jgi:tight adherence protein B
MTTDWLIAACLVCGALLLSFRPGGTPLHRLGGGRTRVPAGPRTVRPSRRQAFAVVGVATAAGWLFGGPVAALVGVAYAGLVMIALDRRAGRRRAAAERSRSLDDLCALAADLRAGLPPAVAAARGATADQGRVVAGRGATADQGRVAALTAAIWRLAERTGAPAADLIERIEADARAADRAQLSAAAQAAGAQATALLLAALPLGGIGLGLSIGVDPLEVLLHTPVGAACAVGAVLLQCAGLAWCDRLARRR